LKFGDPHLLEAGYELLEELDALGLELAGEKRACPVFLCISGK
jgi:hypothetical protein